MRKELCEKDGYDITYRDDNVMIEDMRTAEAILFDNDGKVIFNNFSADRDKTERLTALFRMFYPGIVKFREFDAEEAAAEGVRA